MKLAVLLFLFFSGCPLLVLEEILLEEKVDIPVTSSDHACSCDPKNTGRKEYETCNIQGKYKEDGDYLCCPFCMKVCLQKPRQW